MMGLGNSVVFTPMAVMAFSTLPREQITEGSAVFATVRNLGSSLFISLSVLTLLRTKAISYAELAEFVNPFRFAQNALGHAGNWDIDPLSGLFQISSEMSCQAAMVGYIIMPSSNGRWGVNGPDLWIDATFPKVPQGGRVVSVAVTIAVGVKTDRRCGVFGVSFGPSEAGTVWLDFLRELVQRGLSGAKLVVSDAHQDIKVAMVRVLNTP